MRIGILTSGVVWTPGGSYLVMFEYANRLAERGHRVTLAFPVGFPSGKGVVKWLYPLKKAVAWFDLRRDIQIQKHYPWNSLPDVDVWVGMLPIPTILNMLKTRPSAIFIQHPKEVESACGQPHPVIAVSKHLHEEIRKCGHEVQYIPNGIDHERFHCKREPMSQERPYDICFSLVPKSFKDPHTGLRALGLLKRHIPSLRILVFGPSVKKPKADFEFVYRSRVPYRSMPDLYNLCKIFLSSSRLEGFHLPGLEAMACGCLLVTTDNLGNREYAIHGRTAFVSPPGDFESLARHMTNALENPKAAREIAIRGIQWAQRFDWKQSARLLEAVLKKVASKS